MEEEQLLEEARETYRFLIDMFNRHELPYEEHPEQRMIVSMTVRDDLAIPFSITVDPYHRMVCLVSPLSFDVPEERRAEMAVAVCTVNQYKGDGCFKFSPGSGNMIFYLGTHYADSPLSEAEITFMMKWTFDSIAENNNRFMGLASGEISLETFLNEVSAAEGEEE